MDRRNFVSTSLLAAAAFSSPSLLGKRYSTANELRRFKGFTSTRPWNFDAASKHLASLGHHQFPVLRAALCSEDEATCCLAACIAKAMNQDALPLLPELVALVQDDQSPSWFRAVIAIGSIGETAQVAAPVLERRLGHSNALMQLDVVNSLVRIQPSRLDGLSDFFHAALDHFELAFPACWMVGELGNQGRRFLPQLEALVLDHATDVRPDIRCEAARAIYKITDNSDLPSVQLGVQTEMQLLTSPDRRIRRIALSRKRTCGPVTAFTQTRSHKSD